MATTTIASSYYTVGLERSLKTYSHITSEDELRQLLKSIDDFDERCKIRARIKEINEKNYNSRGITEYSSSVWPSYQNNEISQRRRRQGVDETAKVYHQRFPIDGSSLHYSNYSRRYSNSSVEENSYSNNYRKSSIDEKFISHRSSNATFDDKYNYRYRNLYTDGSSYRKYSNTSLETSDRYDSIRRKSSTNLREDEKNNNTLTSQEPEYGTLSHITDYYSYRLRKDEEESKEIWNIEDLKQMTISELENLLNGTRNFNKRRDIRTVLRNLKERNSSSNISGEQLNHYNNSSNYKGTSEYNTTINGSPAENNYNNCSITVNLLITPKQTHKEILLDKITKEQYTNEDAQVTSKINALRNEPNFYNSSRESKNNHVINDLNQTIIDGFSSSKEIFSKVDIVKEENEHKYPPKRMLSKRSSGYSSSYSSLDDDKDEEKDEVFEKESEKEDKERSFSDPDVLQLKENLKVFAEIQKAKAVEAFHPTVSEVDDEDETDELSSSGDSGTCEIVEVFDTCSEITDTSSTQIVTHPDDERNIPITLIKEEPEEIEEESERDPEVEDSDKNLANITAEPIIEEVDVINKNTDMLIPKINEFEKKKLKNFNNCANDNFKNITVIMEKNIFEKEKTSLHDRYRKAILEQKELNKFIPSKVPIYVSENKKRIIEKMEQFGRDSGKGKMSEEQIANLQKINDEEELQKLLDASEDYDVRKKIRERLREVRQKRREKTEANLKRREDDREKTIQDKLKASQDQQARTLAMYDEMAKSAPAGGKKVVNIETYKTGDGGTKTVTTTTVKDESDKDGKKSTTNIKETKTVTLTSSKDSQDSGKTLANAQEMVDKMAKIPGVTGQVTMTTTTTTYSSKGGPPQTKTETKTQTFGTPGGFKRLDIFRLGKGPMSPAQAKQGFQKLDIQTQNAIPTSPTQLSPSPRPNVTRSPSAIKQMLLDWCAAKTKGYEHVNITNFSGCWNDGMAFCALIHHFCPDAFDYSKLDPKNRRYNFDLAFKTAEDKADIAPLLDTDDMVMMKNPDWKCVFTYVQSFYRKFHNVP